MYTVYKHRNKQNNKIYIGITKRKPEIRWNNGKGYKSNPYFYQAIQKYGWENFEHTILIHGLTANQASSWEIKLIKYYQSSDSAHGYNLTYGGLSFSAVPQIKEKLKGRKHPLLGKRGPESPNYGRKHTEETKRKISAAHKGLKHTEETKRKLSMLRKGKQSGINSPMYGTHPSKETLKKLSESHKGKTLSDETKKKLSIALKGRKHSEETKRKLSILNKGKKMSPEQYEKCAPTMFKKGQIPWNKEIPCSEDTKEKLRKINMGRTHSEETRKKISNALKGREFSEETRKKISNALKGEKHPNYGKRQSPDIIFKKSGANNSKSKKVLCIETQEIFGSSREASKKYGTTHIHECCNGKRKTAAKLHWKYI